VEKGKSYIPIPKYPAQIEDLTLILPQQTKIGEVISSITSIDKRVADVSLKDIYKDAFTFQISYQDAEKTLTNNEVEVLRNKVITIIKTKFGGNIKE
jgi:phenylalanyl-tRNA synthetase beta chain